MYKKISFIFLITIFLMNNCSNKQNKAFSIDYEQYQLDNGLTIILHEDKSDPIVGVAIQYHVGSNREIPGRTGFAHLFELAGFFDSFKISEGISEHEVSTHHARFERFRDISIDNIGKFSTLF